MKKLTILSMMFLLFAGLAGAQQEAQLPVDPKVRFGKLDNGLTYYIRHNDLPKERVNFYIAQKVGSILEEDNQRGLAHFLEHMAFNGSKHFPENRLVKYLETIGVKFGTNLNAYTGFDNTVYYISDVPVKRTGAIDSCLTILHDWSGALLLDEKEIDKERGVIREEMRSRNEAQMRQYEKLLPLVMPDSKYANRMPIGTEEVVMNFRPEELRAYYKKWYRPDLQGIIIVGDVDIDDIERRLKSIFADIPAPVNPAERVWFGVADNAEPLAGVVTDKESPYSIVYINFKHKPLSDQQKATMTGFIYNYLNSIAQTIVGERMRDLSQLAEPPFVQAGGGNGNFLVATTEESWSLYAVVRNNDVETALKTIAREARRIDLYGFTQSEYDRARSSLLTSFENMFNERDKTQSGSYCNEYVDHFLNGGYIPGIEVEYNIVRSIGNQIPLAALNTFTQEMISDSNIVVYLLAPEKADVAVPTAARLIEWFNAARSEDIQPLVEKTNDQTLLDEIPEPGIINTINDGNFGSKELSLSNGVTVILKPTDLKDDEVLMTAFSPGGASLFPQTEQANIDLYSDVSTVGGIGKFSATDLDKALAGKRVNVSPNISLRSEGFSGSSSVKDFETMLQLIYLNFTAPRHDEDAFQSLITRAKSQLESIEVHPQIALQDTLLKELYFDQFRHKRLRAEDLQNVNYETIENWRKDRYADASDFTFIFTGNLDTVATLPLIARYLANLPVINRKENFVPLNEDFNRGINKNSFRKVVENQKSTAVDIYWSVFDYTLKNRLEVDMLSQILRIIYTEKVREEEGGTYGVSVGSNMTDYPEGRAMIQISFETDPAKVEELNSIIHSEFRAMAENGPSEENFNKVKEYIAKAHSDRMQENSYWQSILQDYYQWGRDNSTEYDKTLRSITAEDIRLKAKALLDAENLIEVIMTGIKEESSK
jgi:zinc protease